MKYQFLLIQSVASGSIFEVSVKLVVLFDGDVMVFRQVSFSSISPVTSRIALLDL